MSLVTHSIYSADRLPLKLFQFLGEVWPSLSFSVSSKLFVNFTPAAANSLLFADVGDLSFAWDWPCFELFDAAFFFSDACFDIDVTAGSGKATTSSGGGSSAAFVGFLGAFFFLAAAAFAASSSCKSLLASASAAAFSSYCFMSTYSLSGLIWIS